MKRMGWVLALSAGLFVAGCNEEPKVTAEDKANLERLSKEGIGARPVDGAPATSGKAGDPMKGGEAKTPEDAQPGPP